jgi:hypothetical protein
MKTTIKTKDKDDYALEILRVLNRLNIGEALEVLDAVKNNYYEMFENNLRELFDEPSTIPPWKNKHNPDYTDLPF